MILLTWSMESDPAAEMAEAEEAAVAPDVDEKCPTEKQDAALNEESQKEEEKEDCSAAE